MVFLTFQQAITSSAIFALALKTVALRKVSASTVLFRKSDSVISAPSSATFLATTNQRKFRIVHLRLAETEVSTLTMTGFQGNTWGDSTYHVHRMLSDQGWASTNQGQHNYTSHRPEPRASLPNCDDETHDPNSTMSNSRGMIANHDFVMPIADSMLPDVTAILSNHSFALADLNNYGAYHSDGDTTCGNDGETFDPNGKLLHQNDQVLTQAGSVVDTFNPDLLSIEDGVLKYNGEPFRVADQTIVQTYDMARAFNPDLLIVQNNVVMYNGEPLNLEDQIPIYCDGPSPDYSAMGEEQEEKEELENLELKAYSPLDTYIPQDDSDDSDYDESPPLKKSKSSKKGKRKSMVSTPTQKFKGKATTPASTSQGKRKRGGNSGISSRPSKKGKCKAGVGSDHSLNTFGIPSPEDSANYYGDSSNAGFVVKKEDESADNNWKDEEGNGEEASIPKTPGQKKERKQRDPRPKLQKWNDSDWKMAVLGIVWACGEKDIDIPWDDAAPIINQFCSGGALQQALLKLRRKLQGEGKTVPGPLKMTWTRSKKNSKPSSSKSQPAKPTPSSIGSELSTVKPAEATRSRLERKRPTAEQGTQACFVRLKVPRWSLDHLENPDAPVVQPQTGLEPTDAKIQGQVGLENFNQPYNANDLAPFGNVEDFGPDLSMPVIDNNLRTDIQYQDNGFVFQSLQEADFLAPLPGTDFQWAGEEVDFSTFFGGDGAGASARTRSPVVVYEDVDDAHILAHDANYNPTLGSELGAEKENSAPSSFFWHLARG
ncbi:hypothetical protein K469DRAFT_691798 [Zopfia rhizophila CBS 207.26]|uniref:Uncharacterized protein n=1 Tax=Zopfia rhizophila CBS 207.26 TaxID=1314779 RepID=A0A6A6DU71_9PEZI|nr:hypothetical protein K469DRAFT_691798 [Zopfia rhizophila CBS 207.26]